MADERLSIYLYDEDVVCHSGTKCTVCRERFRHLRLPVFYVSGNLYPEPNGPPREDALEQADVVLAVDRHRPGNLVVLRDHCGILTVSGRQPKLLHFSCGAGPHGFVEALFHVLWTLDSRRGWKLIGQGDAGLFRLVEPADGLDRTMSEVIVRRPRFASEIQSAGQRTQ